MIKISYFTILCSIVIFNVNAFNVLGFDDDDSELVLVNVVFRHGDRTPALNMNESYPNDKHCKSDFFPYGSGQLTNTGKQRAYRFGELLRNRYNNFLGDIYLQEHVKARSTSVIRSKMTLALVLAALYPPRSVQRWSADLNWQPINTISLPIHEDGLLLPVGCPTYNDALKKAQKTFRMRRDLNRFNNLAFELSLFTGKNITSLWEMYLLYHTLVAESALGLQLPVWVNNYFPYGRLRDAAILQYRINSYNTVLNRRNGGVLLNRIVKDMQSAINGKLNGRKINLYCGQDLTMAGILHAFGVYENHIPEYCSGLIVELRVKDGEYYVKVLYHLGIPGLTTEVRIPGCDVMCPLDMLLKLRRNVIATGEDLLCDVPEPLEL